MRNRKQAGQVIRIGDRWYVRYWERRTINGIIERKRVTHQLGQVTTRGKRPPADIVGEAERHMATVNSGTIPPDRIVNSLGFRRACLSALDRTAQPSFDSERLQGHLGRSSEATLRRTLAERHSHLPRPRMAEPDRSGGRTEPQHAEAHQERREWHFHAGEAVGLFPSGRTPPETRKSILEPLNNR